MNDSPLSQETVDSIFSQLDAADVDQFYRGYQRWRFQQRINALHEQIDALQQRIAANRDDMQRNAPSPMALASLARLQLRGVQDTDLLDRLLDRSEEWLDRTIQRLEYCEQTGLIGDDYTKWCEHALEGAYDWIDSLTGANDAAPPQGLDILSETDQDTGDSESLPQTTEAMLLQKLMSEEDDATLKLPSVPATPVLPETTSAELSEVPAEQIAPEEPEVTAAPESEIAAEGEIIQPTGGEQHSAEEELTFPKESAAAATELPPESEATVIADEDNEPDETLQATIANESNKPDEAIQEISADNSSEQNNPALAGIVQEPAPSEQYGFPEDLDDLPPITAEASPARDTLPPSMQATAPSTQPVSRTAQQTTAPPARQPRKRNLWQKLIYILLGN